MLCKCTKANIKAICVKINILAIWKIAKKELQKKNYKTKRILRIINKEKIKYRFGLVIKIISNK